MWGQQGWKSLANEGREKLNSPVTSSWGDETFASGRDSSQYVKSKAYTDRYLWVQSPGTCGDLTWLSPHPRPKSPLQH